MLSRAFSKQFQYFPVTVKEFTSGFISFFLHQPPCGPIQNAPCPEGFLPTKRLTVQISPGFVNHRGIQAKHPDLGLFLACFVVLEARNQDLQISHRKIFSATVYRLHVLPLGTIS